MNIYSDQTADTVKKYVESNTELKTFIKELNHKYGVVAVATKRDTVGLAYPNGIPFGVVYTFGKDNKQGETVTGYAFISDFINKERGRGSDKYTRESSKISQLIKLIEVDKNYRQWDKHICLNSRLYDLARKVRGGVEDALDMRYAKSIEFNRETSIAMLKSHFENQMITDPAVIKSLERYYELYKTSLTSTAKAKEITDRFFNSKCHYILVHDGFPAVVGTLEFKLDGTNNKYEAVFHDDMKSYTTMDALAIDRPDLVVSYKMWRVNYEVSKDNRMSRIDEGNVTYELERMLPYHDTFNADLDVLTFTSNASTLYHFGSYRYMVVPVAGANNA